MMGEQPAAGVVTMQGLQERGNGFLDMIIAHLNQCRMLQQVLILCKVWKTIALVIWKPINTLRFCDEVKIRKV